MTSILYLIIASNNSEHIRDENSQRKTWARDTPNVIWLRGGKEEKFDSSSRTLFVKVEENFENILTKTIEGIKWCLDNREFDFLIRSNVSTYFDENQIKLFLNSPPCQERFFGGFVDFINFAESPHDKRIFVNGAGIFMNRNVAEFIVNMDLEPWRGMPDDYSLSQYLISKDVFPIWIPRGNIGATSIFRRRSYYRLKSSENVFMAERRMFNLHKILTSPSKSKRFRAIIHFYLDEITNARTNFKTIPRYLASVYSIVSSKVRYRIVRKPWKSIS